MSGQQEHGIIYHIDFELLRKAREMDIQKQIGQLDNQIENAEQDLQLLTATESALDRVQRTLEQMRDIAVEANSNPRADRDKLNKKFEAHKTQIGAIIKSATFAGVNLLDGSMGNINAIIAAIDETLK